VADEPDRGASEAARQFAAREREMQAARAAEDAIAREAEASIHDRRVAGYDNRLVAWAGLAIALLLVIVGMIVVNRLIDQNRLEDCVMAHRHDCADLLDRR
jgi:hypothetical protein